MRDSKQKLSGKSLHCPLQGRDRRTARRMRPQGSTGHVLRCPGEAPNPLTLDADPRESYHPVQQLATPRRKQRPGGKGPTQEECETAAEQGSNLHLLSQHTAPPKAVRDENL